MNSRVNIYIYIYIYIYILTQYIYTYTYTHTHTHTHTHIYIYIYIYIYILTANDSNTSIIELKLNCYLQIFKISRHKKKSPASLNSVTYLKVKLWKNWFDENNNTSILLTKQLNVAANNVCNQPDILTKTQTKLISLSFSTNLTITPNCKKKKKKKILEYHTTF